MREHSVEGGKHEAETSLVNAFTTQEAEASGSELKSSLVYRGRPRVGCLFFDFGVWRYGSVDRA